MEEVLKAHSGATDDGAKVCDRRTEFWELGLDSGSALRRGDGARGF